MSNDGATEQILPGRAFETVLGGKEQPTEAEAVVDFEQKVRRASLQPTDYDGAGLACARVVLEYLEQHPEDVGAPAENLYDWDAIHAEWAKVPDDNAAQVAIMDQHRTTVGLYDRIKEDAKYGPLLSRLDLTGFLWGWGFNAAQKVLGLPSRPNPAIIEMNL